MSRLAKRIITIPSGVTVDLFEHEAKVVGVMGENRVLIPRLVSVVRQESGLKVAAAEGTLKKRDRALVGTLFRLLENAIKGSAQGFSKRLEVTGVGFKVAVAGQTLTMSLGYSHPIEYRVGEGMKVAVEKNSVTITGPDKQRVGQTAAEIRNLRKPEPYKGTGIRYSDEVVRRKAGKQVKAAGAG